jgi:hypothetical protein
MAISEPTAAIEVAFDEWVMRLDGTVFELFHRLVSPSSRYHVSHLAVEAKPRQDGLKIKLGHETSGVIIGQSVNVPAERCDAVLALFAESRRRRDALAS